MANIPKNWTEKKISEIANISVGKDVKEGSFSKILTVKHIYPVYSNTVEKHGFYGYYDYPEYKKNSLTIVGRGAGLGMAFYRKGGFGAIGRLLVLSPKNQDFDGRYLSEYINNRFRLHHESGGIPQLPGITLGKYKVVLPPLPEQRAIADILSTWDEAIEKMEKLIEAKEKEFRGLVNNLMQNPQVISSSGIWKNIKLSEICDIKKGSGLSKDNIIENGENPCVLYGELYTIYPEVIDTVISKTNNKGKVISKKGDILIPSSTTTTGIDLANATALNIDGVILGGDINILRPSLEGNYNPIFLAYYLTHIKKYEIARYAQGITIVHLYGRDILKLNLCIPPIEAQNKIALILVSVKKQINILIKIRAKHKEQKRGLMQKLLTGEWRVKV